MNPPRITTLMTLAALCGCTSLGPRTVQMDRLDYTTVIADSWKEQTLLNIVKLRYMDLPVFVDVSSVVAGYSLQTGVTLGVDNMFNRPNTLATDATLQGIYTDRPTITYMPMTGDKFVRGLASPIDPRNIFFMIQAGHSADFLLAMTVESLNGLRNRSTLAGEARDADPEFVRVLQLLRQLQHAGGIGMRVEEDKARGSTALIFFHREDVPEDVRAASDEMRRLLHLPEDRERFTLVYSPMRGAEDELAVNSRSMLQIMMAFASEVEVPEVDVVSGAAGPGFQGRSNGDQGRIHSGRSRPNAVYSAVRYRGHWFWVEDHDLVSKRALAAMNLFFAMSDSSGGGQLPLVTIPAQ